MRISSQIAHRFVRMGIPGLLLILLLTACGGTGGSANSTGTSNGTLPQGGTTSTPTSSAGKITEFALPTTAHNPGGITKGPDSNLWFTEHTRIGRITPTGTITEFVIPIPHGNPAGITAGSDGNLWFAENGAELNSIGRITPTGTITDFPTPTFTSTPTEITVGPDGNIWFTEQYTSQIGRITIGK